MLYGSCYYPEHRTSSEWTEDLSLMQTAGLNAVRIGEFAWTRLEPAEGRYDMEWLDEFIKTAARYAVYIVLCPPMRTVPAWLVEKNPSIRIETSEGVLLEYASRYSFCINHPLLRQRSSALASVLAQRYGDHPFVAGWHLDNEIGDEPDCHCPVCKEHWQNWLKSKYKNIDNLNQAWGTVFWSMEYCHFGQISTPRATKTVFNPSMMQAWRQFRSSVNTEVVKLLADAIQPQLSNISYISTNNQMPWNNHTDYYEMAELLDITGTNYYPPYGENCRSLAFGLAANRSFKKAPFHVYELRSEGHSIIGAASNTPEPGELERLTLHTIANGADAVFYFPWKRFPYGAEQNHGALTDYAGKPTRIYHECERIGSKLRRIASMLSGSMVVSDIAVLYDFPSRWHAEEPSPWTGETGLYMKQVNTLYHTVRNLGFNCDAVGRNGNFTAYKLLLVPMLPLVDDELVHKLAEFTASGGIILFHPMCGIKDMDACYYPDRMHEGLKELLGLRHLETASSSASHPVYFTWRNHQYHGRFFQELIKSEGCSVEGEFASEWYADYPAVIKNKFGKGESWMVTTFAEESFYKDLIGSLTSSLGISEILGVGVTPPSELEVTLREAADGTSFIFILNCTNKTVGMELTNTYPDIWNEESVSGEIMFAPHQVRILVRDNS
ncbi:beta-galactosidase [Paenibacillus dokdonensis]|uniref:beta-galactosidase n=1 Tax=Paenibacillus dokdonensis TaxID=2567944 RepID=UPI001457C3C0|nr:beta-galactosidase [Paenibacillus dokdonensis]